MLFPVKCSNRIFPLVRVQLFSHCQSQSYFEFVMQECPYVPGMLHSIVSCKFNTNNVLSTLVRFDAWICIRAYGAWKCRHRFAKYCASRLHVNVSLWFVKASISINRWSGRGKQCYACEQPSLQKMDFPAMC